MTSGKTPMKKRCNPACDQHHSFHSDKQHIERRTFVVVVITFLTMAVEIAAGWITHSMALFADGWHMGTHAFALGISLAAYAFARKHADNVRFAFGTWKAEILGAYTSALLMAAAAAAMAWTSVERLLHPMAIEYSYALIVAIAGLVVNMLCAVILNSGRTHAAHNHDHHGPEGHSGHAHTGHQHEDLNLKSAYLHVLADALTSFFAIGALLGAMIFKTVWLDPAMGLVGAVLIFRWAFFLVRDSASILLDHERDSPITRSVRKAIESDGDSHIRDFHAWRVSDGRYACVVSVVSRKHRTADEYRERLSGIPGLIHTTIETGDRRKKG
jgi:cation diffusion facilitator family transporter